MFEKPKNQELLVLEYMQAHGNQITTWEAIQNLHVTRLSAKIFNLRKSGYVINKEMKFGVSADGRPQRWAVYTLEE